RAAAARRASRPTATRPGAARSAGAVEAPRPSRPCIDGSRERVACLFQLCAECVTTRGLRDAQDRLRARAQPEQRVVERLYELGARAVDEHLDERAPDGIARVAVEPVAAEACDEIAALL